MSTVRNNVMLSSFQVVCVLFVIAFLIVVYSGALRQCTSNDYSRYR